MAPFLFGQDMIINITFLEIKQVWETHLWPGRKDIEPASAMLYLSGYSMRNFELPAFYFGIYDSSKLIGVNSGHMCNDGSFRSRGLWVDPIHRKNGLGLELLRKTIHTSSKMGASFCWSLPRSTSWPVYEKAGFNLTSAWIKTDTSDANAYCRIDHQ